MMIKHAMFAAVSLALLGLPQAATAQNSSGQINSKGPFVEADIYSYDADGIYREIYVYTSTTTDHQPGGPPYNSTFAIVFYDIYNTITGQYDFGSGFLDAPTLSVDKKLVFGSLNASGTAYSFIDGSAHTVSLALRFAPNGPQITSSGIRHFTVGSMKYTNKYSATYYNAPPTGNASLDGFDFGNFGTNFADYGIAKSASLTIGQ